MERPKESITLAGAGYTPEPIEPDLRQVLDGAQHLKMEKKYAEAERIYHRLTLPGFEASFFDNLNPFETFGGAEPALAKYTGKNRSKYPRSAFEEALFGEAECQRLQKHYRDAGETYTKLLVTLPHSRYTMQACQGLFEIADYWLEPTRRQMNEYQEQLAGKRWMVTPAMYFHWDRDMPIMDAEGHATNLLNTIRLHDVRGEMGKKALLYLGTIHFFRHDYREADFYFTQLHKYYPNEPEAAKAIKQSVICKQLATGGSLYDLRGVEESKRLLMANMNMYPDLKNDDEWVRKQLVTINVQQADRDYRVAEFYRRTGHPGSAYFYYELVIRRYPGTQYAAQAQERKTELKARVEAEQREQAAPPPEGPQAPRLLPNLMPPAPPLSRN
jgi:outer membrane protein assembly factor BamD (BamD/ComL family)